MKSRKMEAYLALDEIERLLRDCDTRTHEHKLFLSTRLQRRFAGIFCISIYT